MSSSTSAAGIAPKSSGTRCCRSSRKRVSPIGSLKQARADIVAELQEQGYWQPLVSYGITRRDEEGRNVAINFSVQPFRQAHVGRIDFVGNDHIPTETLLGTIGTQARRWLRGGTFTTRQWQQDQRSILMMYRQMGFLQARVTLPACRSTRSSRGCGSRQPSTRVGARSPARSR